MWMVGARTGRAVRHRLSCGNSSTESTSAVPVVHATPSPLSNRKGRPCQS